MKTFIAISLISIPSILSCSSEMTGTVVNKAHYPKNTIEVWQNGFKNIVTIEESYVILVKYNGDTIDFPVTRKEYDSIQINDEFAVNGIK